MGKCPKLSLSLSGRQEAPRTSLGVVGCGNWGEGIGLPSPGGGSPLPPTAPARAPNKSRAGEGRQFPAPTTPSQVPNAQCTQCLRCEGYGGEVAAAGGKKVEAVYVFGDSYADTGNHDPLSEEASIYKPWRAPYGCSWPATPSGRYSNGHVFTDFFASYMRVKRPVPFRILNISTTSNEEEKEDARVMAISRGINFAFGGSGLFTTLNPFVLNVTTQIQQLSTTIDLGIVTTNNVSESLVLFVINGNDYISYYELHQTFTGIESFIPQVVEQMASDLEKLSDLGFTNFVITNIGPVGCLPYLTYLINYTACFDTFNNLSVLHNTLLASQLSNLQEKLPESTFLTLDLNNAMNEVIQGGALSMRPCCEGVSGGSCGEVDESGNPLYTVCLDVDASLYWDTIHPTNNGWSTILKILLPSLQDTEYLPVAYAKV